MKVVYAKALSVPEGLSRFFEQGKKYPALDVIGEFFSIDAENGVRYQYKWGSEDPVKWQRLEYPYRDPKAVEDLIEDTKALRQGIRELGIKREPALYEKIMRLDVTLARLQRPQQECANQPADGEVKT